MANGGLAIRPYEESDENQVIQLWQDVFPGDYSPEMPKADIRRKLDFQRDLFLVGVLNGRIVATVMAGFDGHRGWLYLVAVHPDHRQQGFGRAILTEAEMRLRDIGCTKINLHTRTTNQGAIAFYESLGYSMEQEVCMGKHVS